MGFGKDMGSAIGIQLGLVLYEVAQNGRIAKRVMGIAATWHGSAECSGGLDPRQDESVTLSGSI